MRAWSFYPRIVLSICLCRWGTFVCFSFFLQEPAVDRNRVSAKIRGIFAPRGCVNLFVLLSRFVSPSPPLLLSPSSSFLFSSSHRRDVSSACGRLRPYSVRCPFHTPGVKLTDLSFFLLVKIRESRCDLLLTPCQSWNTKPANIQSKHGRNAWPFVCLRVSAGC